MRRAIVLAAAVLLALGTIVQPRPALAQLGLDAEYVSPDGSFKFDYPSAWAVQRGSVLEPVAIRGGSVLLHVYGPESLNALSLGGLTQPIDLTLAYRSLTRDQAQADTAPFTISLGERSAACLDLLDASGKPRILVAIPFRDGRLGLVEVITAGPALIGMDQDTALAIAASFDLPTGASQTGLHQYAADWQTAIHELEQTGIIPSGGSLIFTRDLVPFSGTGAFFEPLAEALPTRDVVVSGWLIFTPGGGEGYESCALGARVTLPEGRINAYLEVGFRNSGTLFYADHTGSGAAPVSEELAFGPVAGLPYHVLLIVHGDRLSVFVNGQPAFQDVAVENRSGVFGVSFVGQSAAASCMGNALWAYAIPATTPGVCEIGVRTPANQRNGPGVGHTILDQLPAGSIRRVTGQHLDAAGYRWWQLPDGTWVREDVVQAVGDCARLPDTGS